MSTNTTNTISIAPGEVDSREVIRRYLRTIARRRTINRRTSSYGWKHRVERWAEIVYGQHIYISNDEFIEVALQEGVLGRSCGVSDPNWWFALAVPEQDA